MNDELEIPDPLGESDNIKDEVEKDNLSDSDATLVDAQPDGDETVIESEDDLQAEGASLDDEDPLIVESPNVEIIEKKNRWPTWLIVLLVIVGAAFCCCCLFSVVGISWLWENGDRLFGPYISGINLTI